ncbi:hypothetical protein WMF18_17125 [Sorangium sp. So ce315]|uniref:hypothetical protein n=1 Tax=Sorangium sp. So ce315 TaxID=3133299 RepID=UPI003F5FCD83
MISVAVKVETECGTCRLPTPVNTLAREVSCASCGRPAALADDLWKALLRHPIHDGPKMLLKEGRSTSAGKLSAAYTRRAPSCQGCDKEIPVEDIREVREQATLTCARCAKRTWVRTVPVELAGALPGITHLVGEDPDPAAMASEGAAEAATFPCPQCGSPVPFDGVTRACVCRFCSASVHVPDDFVFRGRRKVAASWFLCFDPSITDAAPAAEAVSAGLFDWEEEPPQVAVDAEGNLYCAATQAHWVASKPFIVSQKRDHVLWSIDPSLNVRWIQRGRLKAARLVLSPRGALLVTDPGKPPQPWLSSETGTPTEVANHSSPGIVDLLRDCDDLTCCADGSLLFLAKNKMRRTASNGVEALVWPHGDSRDHTAGTLMTPCELADHPERMSTASTRVHGGPDGAIYLMSEDGIARFDASGRKSYGVAFSSEPPEAEFCIFGADARGNVYVLRREQLVRINASGEQSVVLESKRDGLPRPEMSLAVCPDGAFWLFGTEGLAWKFDPGGALLFDSGKEPRPEKPSHQDLLMQSIEPLGVRVKKRTDREIRRNMLVGNIFPFCLGLVTIAFFALVVSLMARRC